MSILTTAPAVPNRLLSLYATVANFENGESRERIESLATPSALGSGEEDGESSTSLFTGALQEAKKMGLIEEHEGNLRVGKSVPCERSRRPNRAAEFQAYMRGVLLAEARAEETGQLGFSYALAWFLSRDPFHPLNFSQPPQELVRGDVGGIAEKTELTNLNRYQNFLYWARYLGFATLIGDGATRRAIPDPTKAIAASLPSLFLEKTQVEIEAFVSLLSKILPVLEGGAVRTQVESARNTPSFNEQSLSASTSLALLRLVDDRQVVFESVADARTRILNFGRETRRISAIRLGNLS